MKNDYLKPQRRQYWLSKPISSAPYRLWLMTNESLTLRLQAQFSDFFVDVLHMGMAKPLLGESARMHIAKRESTIVREVYLYGNGQPIVFAHSLLPRKSLRGEWLGLKLLGNKPLGASLFANPKVRRTPLEYKKLTRHHPLYRRATEHMGVKPQALWARRLHFYLELCQDYGDRSFFT